MEQRQLGKSSLRVAPVAFGGNVFGWTVDEKTGFQLLDEFVGAGFNLIDTADSYSRWAPGNKGGESETVIGNWMKQRRNRRQSCHCNEGQLRHGAGKTRYLETVHT